MERKKCPYCGEEIAITAKKCRFCGEWLESPEINTPVETVVPPSSVQPQQQRAEETPVDKEQRYEAANYENSCPSFFNAYFVNPYLRRYADFKGYTTRKSFWLTYAATMILGLGLCGIILLLSSFGTGGIIAGSILGGLIGLAMVVPGIALCVRRLRDADKNPWLILLALIPAVGTIILLIFLCQESKYQDTEEEGQWQMPDWIVTGICAILLVVGIIFSAKSSGKSESYDWGEDEYDVVETGNVSYSPSVADETHGNKDYNTRRSLTLLSDFSDAIDPEFFSYKLEAYRIGSDEKMAQLFEETGSTNVPIKATGMISKYNITMIGWITEEGTIHGRYHNENGINLDFNGFIRPDNSLYIQLGHDSEKSDWYLKPVPSELSSGDAVRYEGKWGKSQKDSYVVFSEL